MQSPFWFSWRELGIVGRFFLLVLASTSIYVVFSASIVLRRVRALAKPDDASTYQRSMPALHARCTNMRQLITSTFYFFGFIFFLLLWEPTWILANVEISVPNPEVFLHDFAYAADVFFVLFVLSLIQWFASARVRACALRLQIDS